MVQQASSRWHLLVPLILIRIDRLDTNFATLLTKQRMISTIILCHLIRIQEQRIVFVAWWIQGELPISTNPLLLPLTDELLIQSTKQNFPIWIRIVWQTGYINQQMLLIACIFESWLDCGQLARLTFISPLISRQKLLLLFWGWIKMLGRFKFVFLRWLQFRGWFLL